MSFMLMSFSSPTNGHSSMGQAQAVSLQITDDAAAPEEVAVAGLVRAAVSYTKAALRVTAQVVDDLTRDPIAQELFYTINIRLVSQVLK